MQNLVILTGAGISAESGLGTFRDKDGIWTKYPLEDLATPEGFLRDPDFVHGFYNERRLQLKTAQPHKGHLALARLEEAVLADGNSFTLVTQNVDNLHEKAGSGRDNLIHMHGELLKIRCEFCGDVTEFIGALSVKTMCSQCQKVSGLRPHIVWFGEMPLEMDRIETRLAACDMFISIGTSGDVYPAAGFVNIANQLGARTVELNLEPSSNAHTFSYAQYGLASEIVPAFVEAMLSPST